MTKKRWQEIMRFVVTGGVSFAVELAVLILLRELLRLDTLIATPIAFFVSVTVNYLLCLFWVFDNKGADGGRTRAAFLLTSLIGLLLNEGLMYLFRILLGEDKVLLSIGAFSVSMYMLNKALSTVIVMIYNYFAKRKVLED